MTDRQNDVVLLSPEMARYCAVIEGLIEKYNLPFARFETGRTMDRQRKVTGHLRHPVIDPAKFFHVILPPRWPLADAVDFVMREGHMKRQWTWGDDLDEEHDLEIKRMYKAFGYIVKAKLGDKVIVGAIDWPNFFDGPHVQLRVRTKVGE